MRRGALLLETLLALALFVAAGGYTLLVMRDGISSTLRSQRQVAAIDLAASRLAAIEAGLVSMSSQEDLGEELSEDNLMRVEVTLSSSAWEGLTLVEVRVLDASDETTDEPIVLAQVASLVPRESGQ